MLTPDELKVAIVMIYRAPCKGDESRNVATLLDKLEGMYNAAVEPKADDDEEEKDGSDS